MRGVFYFYNMHEFIQDVVKDIFVNDRNEISDIIIILPNKRSKVFLRKQISNIAEKTIFSPIIYDIDDFMSMISGIEKISDTELLFEFYDVYLKNTSEDHESFDEFISWAKTLINDYNEIDRELCDTNSLFNYLKAFKDLTHWSNYEKQTDLIKKYKEFWHKIKLYHKDLTTRLFNKRKAYQGLIYREAFERMHNYIESSPTQKHIFIGFNALSKSEAEVIQEIINYNGEIYWDIDKTFLKSDFNNASLFIESYISEWNYYKKNKVKIISDSYRKEKNIFAIGTPKNIGQVKYAGELLASMGEDELSNTAVVLGDEKLLIPLINSIPDNVKNMNITMGYPLKNSNLFSFFYLLIKIHSKNQSNFYYKSIISILSHELISPIIENETDVCKIIKEENLIYISKNEIIEIDKDNSKIYELIFSKWKEIPDVINSCLDLINLIKKYYKKNPQNDLINLELLYQINKIFLQIKLISEEYNFIKNINSLKIIFKQLCEMSSTPFNGAPIKGLQIMGMLETRLLNYKNVIILSMNEGLLPMGNSNSSFIPFEIKKEYNLQTFKEKDAVFAYHFYRLIQRVKNAWFIYNTEPDGMNNGEKSRFITQIEVEKLHEIQHQILISNTPVKIKFNEVYIKTKKVENKIKKLIKKGINASILCLYVLDKIKFFEYYILGLQKRKVEETIASNTLGNIIHDSLEKLYENFEGKEIKENILKEIKNKVENTIKDVSTGYVKEKNLQKGKNVIIIETAKKYVERVIELDQLELKKGNRIEIISVEEKFDIEIGEEPNKYRLKGKIDRIDKINDELRIIDYKTGKKIYKKELILNDIENIKEPEGIYNLQLLIYMIAMYKKHGYEDIKCGIVCLKNMKEGVLEGKFESNLKLKEKELKKYENEIILLINEILDINLAFSN